MSSGTVTLTRPDGSVLELDEFDICCDIKVALMVGGRATSVVDCENPARWAGFYPCCGKHTLVCEPHQADRHPFFCAICNQSSDTLIGWVRL